MQEHEELIWLARSHKLEVIKYSRQLYGNEGTGDDDDDNDGVWGFRVDSKLLVKEEAFLEILQIDTDIDSIAYFFFCCFYYFSLFSIHSCTLDLI